MYKSMSKINCNTRSPYQTNPYQIKYPSINMTPSNRYMTWLFYSDFTVARLALNNQAYRQYPQRNNLRWGRTDIILKQPNTISEPSEHYSQIIHIDWKNEKLFTKCPKYLQGRLQAVFLSVVYEIVSILIFLLFKTGRVLLQ